MKQRISVNELNTLTPEQREKLRELWIPQEADFVVFNGNTNNCIVEFVYSDKRFFNLVDGRSSESKFNFLPLLSVGQCLELLGDNWNHLWNLSSKEQEYEVAIGDSMSKRGENLCDTLWEAVKSML